MSTIRDVLEGRARWALICADNADVLPTLPDKSVAHVITDPPYSRDLYLKFRTNAKEENPRGFDDGRARREMQNGRIGAIDDILESVASQFLRCAQRWVLTFHDVEIGHRWRAAFGPTYVRSGVWVKPNAVPQMSGDRPGQGFECCTIAHKRGRKRWNGGGLPAVWTHFAENSQSTDRAAMGHPCPKPLSLMLELVEQFTDPDDLVLDCFAGTATTGVACLRLGRRFLGVERDPQFAAVARERLEAESRGLTLRDARAGQISLFEAGEP